VKLQQPRTVVIYKNVRAIVAAGCVGLIGPDRARGGLYLLLPPHYGGEVPQGYFAFKSKTYNVFLFFRTIMAKDDNGPDPNPPVALAEHTRVIAFAATRPQPLGRRSLVPQPSDFTGLLEGRSYMLSALTGEA
jgi:hypothetical protein